MLRHGRRRGRWRHRLLLRLLLRRMCGAIVYWGDWRAVKAGVQGAHRCCAGGGHPARAGHRGQQRMARARCLARHGQAEVGLCPGRELLRGWLRLQRHRLLLSAMCDMSLEFSRQGHPACAEHWVQARSLARHRHAELGLRLRGALLQCQLCLQQRHHYPLFALLKCQCQSTTLSGAMLHMLDILGSTPWHGRATWFDMGSWVRSLPRRQLHVLPGVLSHNHQANRLLVCCALP